MFSKEETKDPKLDEHLKNIYVTSREPELQETLQNKNISRPLPMNRENVTSPEMGYHEPVRVTKGRLSIRQAMELIKKHQQDPETNTPSRLAQEFTINPTSAGNSRNTCSFLDSNFLIMSLINILINRREHYSIFQAF